MMQFAGKLVFMWWPLYQRAADDNLAESTLKRIINSLTAIMRGNNASGETRSPFNYEYSGSSIFHAGSVSLLLCLHRLKETACPNVLCKVALHRPLRKPIFIIIVTRVMQIRGAPDSCKLPSVLVVTHTKIKIILIFSFLCCALFVTFCFEALTCFLSNYAYIHINHTFYITHLWWDRQCLFNPKLLLKER